MSEIKYDIEINAPVERVYDYYTNPDNSSNSKAKVGIK
ncbi:MAG: SRPBCC family protein [Nitrososphaeraceae archaeon]|nr:SRPBCC family protein [Nitrososphaeraceae archaeon]